MVGGPNGPGLTPQKTSNFWRKKLRLLEFFWEKNSSPIFSKLVRARAINPFILLVGTTKPCNFYHIRSTFCADHSSVKFTSTFHGAKSTSQVFMIIFQLVKNSWGLYEAVISIISTH